MQVSGFSGFLWDDGNRQKCRKHGVSLTEIEYVLSHGATLIAPGAKNSNVEARFLAIGRTERGRYTFVVFTPRQTINGMMLRPISARYMHQKEIKKYEQEIARVQNG